MRIVKKLEIEDFDQINEFIGTEKELENLVVSNIHEIAENCCWPKIKHIKQQFFLGGNNKGVIDILVIHIDNSVTIIEVKKGKKSLSSDYFVGQLLYYGMEIEKQIPSIKTPRMVVCLPVFRPTSFELVCKYNLPINFLVMLNDRAIYYPPFEKIKELL